MADESIMIEEVCGLPEALHAKQDTLVFDTSPVVGSKNPVTSGGIYDFVKETAQAISSETSSSITDVSSSVSSELAKKADKIHGHTIGEVCGFAEAVDSITSRIDEIACETGSYATKQDLDDLCRSVFTDTASVNIQDYNDGYRTVLGWYGKLSSLGISSSAVDLRSVTFKRGCVSASTPSVAYARVLSYIDGELTDLYRSSVGIDWPSTCVDTPTVFQLEPSTSRRVSSSDSVYIVLSDCAYGDTYTVGTQFGLVATNGGSGSVSYWPTGPGQGAPCVVTGYTPNIGVTYIDASSSGSLEGKVENNTAVLHQEILDAKDSVIYSLCELDKVVSGKQDAISAGCNISITGSTISAVLPNVDSTPTDGSENLVTSGGVKSYVDSVTGYILTMLDEL